MKCTIYFQAILLYLNPANGVLYSNYSQTHQYISWCLVKQRGRVMSAIFQASERVQLRLRSSVMLRARRCSWLATFRRPKFLCSVGNQLHTYAGQHPRRTKASAVRLGFFLSSHYSTKFPRKDSLPFHRMFRCYCSAFWRGQGSNLGRDTACQTEAFWGFPPFVQAIARKVPGTEPESFLPHHFQLIIHTNQPTTLLSIACQVNNKQNCPAQT